MAESIRIEYAAKQIREAEAGDLEEWVALRRALWPYHDDDVASLTLGAKAILDSRHEVCFLAVTDTSRIIGFIEGAIYEAAVGPYAHVEAWFVLPEYRGQGHGRNLMSRLEQWCLHREIVRLTSDTTAKYPASPRAHEGCGFRVIKELRIFMKQLQS